MLADPEIVRHEETGLLVAQEDPRALAAAIERLLLDPDLRSHMAVRARRLIEDDFDIRANAARLRRIFARAALNRDRVSKAS